MTGKDLVAVIGRTGRLASERLMVAVRVLDAKVAWGATRYLVTPMAGEGTMWVDAGRVTLDEAA